jgi:hypothetical protein
MDKVDTLITLDMERVEISLAERNSTSVLSGSALDLSVAVLVLVVTNESG